MERGRVRFWLQAEEISPNVTYKFFANNKELSGADVRDRLKLGLPASSWKDLCVSLHRGLTPVLSATCCHIKAPPSWGEKESERKKHLYSQSLFSSALYAITALFFRSRTRWVMTSLQASLSLSWTISQRKMRVHLPARSLMEEAKHRAPWF